MDTKSKWTICKLVFNLSIIIGAMWFVCSGGDIWMDLMRVAGAIGMVNTITWLTLWWEPS